MCFNPAVSLTTAIIEIFLASFIFIKYRKSSITIFSAIIMYFLGLYQFSEFMLCISENPFLWAKVGFIIYTFLPALGIHATLRMTERKKWTFLSYLVPAFFALYAIFRSDFISYASCNSIFVTVSSLLIYTPISNFNLVLSILYASYYGIFISLSCFILVHPSSFKKDRKKKKIYYLFILGVLLMVIPTFVFLVFLPSLSIRFPSVFCHFAILLAIVLFLASSLDNNKLKSNK
ncbi:MAG: hypothetical protein AABW79_03490 [Nanoarchaeota archaeon]